MQLQNRKALVTGAAGGIGQAIVERLRVEGATVTGTDLDASPADFSIVGNLANPAFCDHLPGNAAQLMGGLDILVNNAGAAWGEPFEVFPEHGWDKAMDLNVKSLFFLTQALHNPLKSAASAGSPGKVINIASIDGLRINPWETYSYQASKAAVIQLTRRMSARLVKDHINVTAIAPGAFASEMNKAARDFGDAVGSSIPSGRIGHDEDMAAVAIYLAARSGDYVVGETIAVDGGVVYGHAADTISP